MGQPAALAFKTKSMINFFRKIRKQLSNDNKPLKYVRYAIGEIVLVVIGILIALQINNWNEKRKQGEQFNLALEQAYNDIDLQIQNMEMAVAENIKGIALFDLLLEQPEEISDVKLPFILFYLDIGALSSDRFNLQSINFSTNLNLDQNNLEQLKMAKEIVSYDENIKWKSAALENQLTPILYEAGIPIPGIVLGLTEFDNFDNIDTKFFTKDEISKVRSLVKTDRIRSILRSLKANRLKIIGLDLKNSISDGKSVLNSIAAYYPEVRLFYNDVGIIGTSLNGYDDVGGTSVPLTLTNEKESIWETDLFLKDGTVKFRTRDSWNQNWGGKEFPKGKAIFYWDNIPVKAGNYHIIFNLSEKTYEFIEQD